MIIKVERMTKTEWNLLFAKITSRSKTGPETMLVPSTVEGVAFKGIYDRATDRIAIAWPVDRPPEAQKEFAQKVTRGGEPPHFFDYKPKAPALTIAHERNDTDA